MALELLTNAQMREADRAAISGGIPSFTLMQNAGQAVCDAIAARFAPGSAIVLCGGGNNGGDGYVIARKLMEAGWNVRVLSFAEPATEDAKRASSEYTGARVTQFEPASLVVDALYGTGLSRPIEGAEAELIRRVNESGGFVVAVDIPSDVSGDTGEIMGTAIRAHLTVALCRRKLGHALMPGKQYCGETLVADIGINDAAVKRTESDIRENDPALWLDDFPFARAEQHKYARGHAVITGGDLAHTGAARLAARAALRAGVGLVSIACGRDALPVYAAACEAVMCKPVGSLSEYAALIADPRITAIAIGPGNGVDDVTRKRVLAALKAQKSVVLDADALTAFQENPQSLFRHIRSPCVMTPHEGEFARLFDVKGDKLRRAREAAAQANSVVVLKGPDTVIAAPKGHAVINTNAPPTLATAGSGDVLTGIITGLMAAGMPAFQAACAGVWMHGEAALAFGDGLISEDLPDLLPRVISGLRKLTDR